MALLRITMLLTLLIMMLSIKQVHCQTAIASVPPSNSYTGIYGYQSNFITATCSTHVTSISINKYFFITGGLYGFQVNGLG